MNSKRAVVLNYQSLRLRLSGENGLNVDSFQLRKQCVSECFCIVHNGADLQLAAHYEQVLDHQNAMQQAQLIALVVAHVARPLVQPVRLQVRKMLPT